MPAANLTNGQPRLRSETYFRERIGEGPNISAPVGGRGAPYVQSAPAGDLRRRFAFFFEPGSCVLGCFVYIAKI